MDGVLPIVFLAVILKIPVLFGIWLIWWAAREEPELEGYDEAEDHSFKRWRRDPTRPRDPRRRGPHGGAARAQHDCPPGGRKRTTKAPQPVALPAGHDRRVQEPAGR